MRPHTLFIATGNAGKLRDFAVAAATSGDAWTIAPLPDLARIAAPPEHGETFEENARAKALFYGGHAPGAIVIADDSGLAVDALNGAPGVYSARFAERLGRAAQGAETEDARNNAALLAEMNRVDTHAPRTARYRCVLAAARDGEILGTAEGTVEGELLREPRGTGGFGYDSLFLIPTHAQTMAELDPETRLRLSHRGAALRRLLPQIVVTLI